MTISKSLCSHRWGYPIIDFGKNQARVCCRTTHVSPPIQLLDSVGSDFFLNTDYQRTRRLEMFRGVRHDHCQQCWGLEDNNIQSGRENRLPPNWVEVESNSNYFDNNLSQDSYIKNIDTEEVVQIKDIDEHHSILRCDTPYMIEINLSNYCDLNCLYCSPYFSTKWLHKNADIWLEQVHDVSYPDLYSSKSVRALKEELKLNPSEKFENAFWDWLKNVFTFSEEEDLGIVKTTVSQTIRGETWGPGKASTNNKELRLGIIGGEPISNPQLPGFLDKLCRLIESIPVENRPRSCYWKDGKPMPKPLLWFVTNLNANNNYWSKFLERLPRLAELFMIEITASSEAIGQRGEYIRHGLHWDRFDMHMRELLQLDIPGIEVGFQTSINCLNISNMPDFAKWCKELNDTYGKPVMLKQNVVTDPSMFNPIILDPSYAEYLDEAIDILLSTETYNCHDLFARWPQYASFLKGIRNQIADDTGASDDNWGYGGNRLLTRQDSMAQLYRFCSAMDERRGINFKDVFPEMSTFWDACEKAAND